ncbi:hypothetical protein RM572_21920 [Streptomyces sp. DSM 42041]|uniref:Uncharacterized protein n=1 Tax=Streptomyces hazeniae TaxID=3075538 RepID=A0ABU2NWP4_9ACTN|nr:hypothetical protein [Streptomyces sp. DSM 42041]MDT0381420.1 hypothetical protein [Streptomyces sp. DSM 42041]
MPRLQILELPEGTHDDRPPFALVIDQVTDKTLADITHNETVLAEGIGARHVLVFAETVEIPDNVITLDHNGHPTPNPGPVRVKLDVDDLRAQLDEFRAHVEQAITDLHQRTTKAAGRPHTEPLRTV